MESVIRQVFTAAPQPPGTTVEFHELVLTRAGDTLGTSSFYLLMACTLPAYFLVITMQRAVGFSRRTHIATLVASGAVTALACYLTAAYGMNAIPRHPLSLAYMFLLTQTVSLTSYGLVSFLGPFFPGAAVTLFIMFSVPSSGLTVPVDLLPGFFRFLHPVLPMGNTADALRDVGYYGDRSLGRPTAVLCAWIALGAALIVFGYLKQLRRLLREARAGLTGYVTAPVGCDDDLAGVAGIGHQTRSCSRSDRRASERCCDPRSSRSSIISTTTVARTATLSPMDMTRGSLPRPVSIEVVIAENIVAISTQWRCRLRAVRSWCGRDVVMGGSRSGRSGRS
jgi:hypothetical protein